MITGSKESQQLHLHSHFIEATNKASLAFHKLYEHTNQYANDYGMLGDFRKGMEFLVPSYYMWSNEWEKKSSSTVQRISKP